jgi:hypothetical protein
LKKVNVNTESLFRLNPKQWLNDEIINAFIILIRSKLDTFSCKIEETCFLTTWAASIFKKNDPKVNQKKLDRLFKKVFFSL